MMHLPVLLNPDFTEVRRLSPVSLNLKLNMTPLSTASMTLSEGEEIPSRSFVEIFTAKGSAGVFRAREPETSYGETQTSIELEHAITEVGDSLITESIEEELPLDEAMQMLFSYYKGEAWQMGEINFTDTVVVDVDYGNVLEAIISVIQQVPSYYMTFDFSTSPWTFGLAQVDSQVTAEGRLSRNVSSGSFKNDDSSLATRAYAIYKDGDEEILIHEDSSWGQEHFGLVERKLPNTYESEAKARAAAQKYLDQNNRPRFSISINGTELSDMTGETLDEFEIGRRFRFVFDPVVEPVDEIIKSVEYTDLVADEHNVIVSMNEEEELDYVFDGIKQNEKNNRRTTKNLKDLNDEIHWELYSEDGYFNSRLDFTASHLRTEFMDNLNSMHGELEMTASHLRTEFTDGINDLQGEFEVSASHLRTEFTDGINSLHSEFEVSAFHLRTEFTDGINSLHSEFEVSASHLRTEFTDGQNSLRSEFELSASHLRSEFTSDIGSVRSTIEQTASSISLVVDTTDPSNPFIKAAEISAEMNKDGSTVRINANRIRIGDGSSTVTLNDAMTISGNYTRMKRPVEFGGSNATVRTIINGGTVTAQHLDTTYGGDVRIYDSGGNHFDLNYTSVSKMLVGVNVTGGNVKQFRITDNSGKTFDIYASGNDLVFKDNTENVSWSFSKAVTLSGAWSNGTYTVTASPQGNTRSTQLQIISPVPNSTISRSNKSVSRQFKVQYGPNESSLSDTGFTQTISIDATSVYNYGKSEVTLNDPTWNAISGAMPSSRTVTVTTSGRTNSSGTTDNLSKSVSLYLVKSGLTVYMRTGSTSGTTYAQTTCSDSNLSAGNIKNGVTIFGVTGNYTVSHSPTVSSLTYCGASDPGSGYEKRQANIDGESEYYKFTANCGGQSKDYAFYVNNRSYTSRYDAGFIAGWAAYYDDSHWDSDYYNSNTGKYEAWTPARTVSKNSSGQWVSDWASSAWFSYNNFTGTPEAHSHSEGFYVTITQNTDGSKTMRLSHTYPVSSLGSIPFADGSTHTLYW